MDALEIIRQRRSIRQFTGESVPKADLETIVDAGRLAASGHNMQPWDFIVITDPGRIRQCERVNPWMGKAGAIIAVVLDPAAEYWIQDGGAATQNMLLAATALGYGSCWVEGNVRPHEDWLKGMLGIPADRVLQVLIPIGKPAESPTKPKKSLEKVLHWERW